MDVQHRAGAIQSGATLKAFSQLKSDIAEDHVFLHAHFTCAALVESSTSKVTQCACGSSLGGVYLINYAECMNWKEQRLKSVCECHWQGHYGCVNALAAIVLHKEELGATGLLSCGSDNVVRLWTRLTMCGVKLGNDSMPSITLPLAPGRAGLVAEPMALAVMGSAAVVGCNTGQLVIIEVVQDALAIIGSLPDVHLGPISELRTSSAERRVLLSASEDASVILWRMRTFGTEEKSSRDGLGTALMRICPHAGCAAPLSLSEYARWLGGDVSGPRGGGMSAAMVSAACFDASGTWIAAVTRGGTLAYYSCQAEVVTSVVALSTRVQAIAADELDIYLGCDNGVLLSGPFFLKTASEAYPLTMPRMQTVTDVVMQSVPGKNGHLLVVVGMPSSIAVSTASRKAVLASWHGSVDVNAGEV